MNEIKLNDKTFRMSMPEAEILTHVRAVAERINSDYAGRCPLFLAVLNGSFMFASDLMKMINLECEISFVKLSSYQGTTSTGTVSEVIGVNQDLTGRDIIIIEDIVETGTTMHQMLETLKKDNPASVKICSLFFKPTKLTADIEVDYPALTIPDDFIVGYGLDYNGLGRNLKDIYTITK